MLIHEIGVFRCINIELGSKSDYNTSSNEMFVKKMSICQFFGKAGI